VNREIKITIIGCAIIFASIGFVALNGMNHDQRIPQPLMIDEMPQTAESIADDSQRPLAKYPQTTLSKIDDNLGIEKTITILSIPENNKHPWGIIKGKVNSPAQGYPVIIQFFKSLDEIPVHVAQIDLKGDGSFEYKFRVMSTNEEQTIHYFEGDYYIKIFKTVNTQ
jgi:hypothetical protein